MGGRKGQVAWNKKEPIKKVCKCGKIFFVPPSLNRIKSCSGSCARKGKNPWNKGLTAHSDERVAEYTRKGSVSKKGKSVKHNGQFKKGSVPWNFKGDKVGYHALHDRVERKRGKAKEYKCIDCGKQAYHWSNVDGKYGTDVLKDFEPRCTSCHRKHDYQLRKMLLLNHG